MIVACPNCSTGYLFPESLMGPGGARVRCPRCQNLFLVDPEGRLKAPVAPAAGAAPESAPAPEGAPAREAELEASRGPAAAPAGQEPLAVARRVLAELARREGAGLERAREEKRLFATFGPALMEAYESYRRLAGEEAGAAPFREAVRERWGVELLPLVSRDA